MATKQISARERNQRIGQLENSNHIISGRLIKINNEIRELAEEKDRLLNIKIENTNRINKMLAEELAATTEGN